MAQDGKWSDDDMACVATYNVLEHEDKMDQFEDADVPFESAAALEMGELRYWPGVSLPAGGMQMLALLKAQEFLDLVARNFTAVRRHEGLTRPKTIRAAAKVFARKKGTLAELADIVRQRGAIATR